MASSERIGRVHAQCARGSSIRNTYSIPLIAANARTNMTNPSHILADGIKNTTIVKGVFAAPSKGTIARCYVNADNYATCATGGTVVVKFTKAEIGTTDVDLCSNITVGTVAASVPTAQTAIDGTLSTTTGALDLIDGQLVYATMVISNHDITTRTNTLAASIEFFPTE